MITNSKVTETFYTVDEFCKKIDSELEKNLLSVSGRQHRPHKAVMFDSEIMAIQSIFYLGGNKCFIHFGFEVAETVQPLILQVPESY